MLPARPNGEIADMSLLTTDPIREGKRKGPAQGETPGGFCLRSVFLGQHDGENADGFLVIGGVLAAEFHGRIVIVDLP